MQHLNPQQKEAVTNISGPLLVLAGAGSGKTSVITHKIAYLIESCDMKAHNIVAVTFTNKAAKEMKARVQKLLDAKLTRGLQVSTFHTLGLKILQAHAKDLGFRNNISIFDEQDVLNLVHELAYHDHQADKDMSKQIVYQISRWKNTLTMPEQALNKAQRGDEKAAAIVYGEYIKHMHAYNAVDFDDLIMLPTQLLKTNTAVREKWQNKVHYLLVDEYQDTNESQYQLIKLLTGTREKFTMVGDDDQSIYAWRGAQPENLSLLQKDFPRLKVVKLEQNYRSCGRILRSANKLISHNPHLFEKALWSENVQGDPIKIIACPNEQAEAEQIVSLLITHHFQNKGQYHNYAILYRSNHQAFLMEKTLRQQRIPYKITGSTSFFSKTEIKDMLAYLRLISNPNDDNAFLRVINTPRREIGPKTLEKLGQYAKNRQVSLFNAIEEIGLSTTLSTKTYEKLSRFATWLNKVKEHIETTDATLQALTEMADDISYDKWINEQSSSTKAAEVKLNNVKELFDWVNNEMIKLEENNKPSELSDVLNKLIIMDLMDQKEEQTLDQVQLYTLHSAKGLEFPHVFMMGLEEGLLPHQTSIDEDNIEEERRLAYVGITRAQKTLTISYALKRKRFGTEVSCDPSRFLNELPEEELKWLNKPGEINEAEQKKRGKAHLNQLRAMLKK